MIKNPKCRRKKRKRKRKRQEREEKRKSKSKKKGIVTEWWRSRTGKEKGKDTFARSRDQQNREPQIPPNDVEESNRRDGWERAREGVGGLCSSSPATTASCPPPRDYLARPLLPFRRCSHFSPRLSRFNGWGGGGWYRIMHIATKP